MTLNEIFQEYVDMEHEELIENARVGSAVVVKYLKENIKSETIIAGAYIAIISTFIGADGSVDETEYEFCKEVWGFPGSYDDFCEIVKATNCPEIVDALDEMIDEAPDEIKAAFVALGCAFCASNGTMTVAEQQLLKKFIS